MPVRKPLLPRWTAGTASMRLRWPKRARDSIALPLSAYTRNVSLTLEVAVRRKCDPDRIEAFLAGKGCQVTGGISLDAAGGSFEIVRKMAKGPVRLCIVDGPLRVETEDLADKLAAMLLAPKWLYQLNFSGETPQRHLNTVMRLAKLIAKEGDGALYDPQEDEVLWPRSRPKRIASRADEPARPELFLDFFMPARANGGTLIRSYLDVCRRFLPEGVPKRYGDYEPLQHRLTGLHDEQALIDFADAASQVEYGDWLFWTATRPFVHSSLSFGDRRRDCHHAFYQNHPHRDRTRPMTQLHASLLGKVAEDEAWADAIELFAAEVARATGAFYASASLGAWTVTGRTWIGIPSTQTWLSWYGRPYADALTGVSACSDMSAFPEGIMVRRGRVICDSEASSRHPLQPHRRFVGVYADTNSRIAQEIPTSIPKGDIESWVIPSLSDLEAT